MGGGGPHIIGWMYVRRGGGYSDAYCVQKGGGGWGGLKIWKKKAYVINGRPLTHYWYLEVYPYASPPGGRLHTILPPDVGA